MARKWCIYYRWCLLVVTIYGLFLCTRVTSHDTTCVSPTAKCGCFIEMGKKIINCRYKSLTTIPAFIDTHQIYDEIRLSSAGPTGTCYSVGCNNISQITANDFANLRVKEIDLRNNQITSVDDKALEILIPDLESIFLEGDGICEIPYEAVAPLSEHLKCLHLHNYGSRDLQLPVVLPFPNLVSLTLENWPRLEYIDPDVFRILQNLRELKVIKMPALEALPFPAIKQLANVTFLEIMDSGIKSISGATFSPVSILKEIKIHNNKHLTHIDKKAFSNVSSNVMNMDISNNNLNSIDFLTNGKWSALTYIDIGYNFEIKTLPGGIFNNTPSLDQLHCQGMGLRNLNEEMFRGLVNLHLLDLSYNQISTISNGAFRNTPALTDLYLNDQTSGHKFIQFQNNAFDGIKTSLEILSLAGNMFSLDQVWNELINFGSLKVIDLQSTGIENLPDKTFRNNTKLEKLVLSNNNITFVSQNTFYGPRNTLQTIDLHGNNIQYLDQCVLSDFLIQPTVILNGNPIKCDCVMVWLYDWLNVQRNKDFLAVNIGHCQSPTFLAGMFFNEFSRSDMCDTPMKTKVCPQLYMESPSTTPLPTVVTLPNVDVMINNVMSHSVVVSWIISDTALVAGLEIMLTPSNNPQTFAGYTGLDKTSYTFNIHTTTFASCYKSVVSTKTFYQNAYSSKL